MEQIYEKETPDGHFVSVWDYPRYTRFDTVEWVDGMFSADGTEEFVENFYQLDFNQYQAKFPYNREYHENFLYSTMIETNKGHDPWNYPVEMVKYWYAPDGRLMIKLRESGEHSAPSVDFFALLKELERKGVIHCE